MIGAPALDPREALLLAAVTPLRTVDSAGRTAALDSWTGPAANHADAPEPVLAALRTAFPMPSTIGAAALEDALWRSRQAVLQRSGAVLDLAVAVRAAMVRDALERDLPALSIGDVRERFDAYRAHKRRDARVEAALARDLDALAHGRAA